MLTDFGVAKMAPESAYLSTECWTRKYAAPEVFEKRYTRKVDIFSLGVTLYECLERVTDEPNCHSQRDWAEQVQRMVARAKRRWGDPIFELLEQMVHPDPDPRPTAKQCFAHPSLYDPSVSPTEVMSPIPGASHDQDGKESNRRVL